MTDDEFRIITNEMVQYRDLSFLPAVIYYRNSKTNSIFISLKSNKFPSSSFTERVKLFADLPCEVSRKKIFFFGFALHVTLSYGLPLTGWLTRPSDRSPFKKFFCLLTRTQLIKYVLGYFNSFTFKEEKEKFAVKKSLKSTFTADLSFKGFLILIAPKLVFSVADAFFEPKVLKNSLSSFYRFFIAVEGRSKN